MGQGLDTTGAYTYRSYTDSDTDGFLELYEAVWAHPRHRDWFDWRFSENPYVDDVPMVVAEREGTIVGAEPCLTFRLAAGESDVLAFQPADWVVHPDHRKRGVFTGMTERLLDRFADGPPALYYNFPSDVLLPGLRKFDWEIAGQLSTYYRVQHPKALLTRAPMPGEKKHATATTQLGRIANPLADGYFSIRDRLTPDVRTVSVDRHVAVPVDLLVDLYERTVPETVHVRRDAAFYRWRFANPRWETTTYVARRDGTPVAACVACTETRAGVRTTALLDVLPCDGGASDDAFRAVLDAVVADHDDADVLKVGGDAIPPTILREFGFRADDSFPMSTLSHQTTLAVRGAAVDDATPSELGECDPTDPEQWHLSLAAQDVE